ncbi:glycosyltransferase family 2 protein [Candidatus Saccharibacteria bacterium]|nr:glycosyltransferase family 2 protein [Candidatus Saccharibacteria bacterium]
MTDIEIPLAKDRKGHYRRLERLPATLSYTMLAMPFILSLINVTLAAFCIFLYMLIYVTRGLAVASRGMQAFRTMGNYRKLDWKQLLQEVDDGDIDPRRKVPAWHAKIVQRLSETPSTLMPKDIVHAIIIATVKESREVLEPTIQSVLANEFNMQQVILVFAYEGRAGQETEDRVNDLIKEYGPQFGHAMAVKHPANLPGEVIGKGGNVTYAARELKKYLKKAKIDPSKVVVTTLDSDNRPDKQYLPALSYIYAAAPKPHRISVQPVTMYTNNIWDAPAPMRVIATGNSFYNIVLSLRPHLLRNFSAHAQSMQSLIETDYWSTRTVVEDGHQYWRSFFRYDGDYRVLPLYIPIYQDAVLAEGYRRTLKAQFVQLRRWTYGASDIAYVISKGYFKPNKVPRRLLLGRTLRLIEGHVSWAVAPFLVLFAGWVPALFYHQGPAGYAAYTLPVILSNIQRFAMVGAFMLVFSALKTLPPRPARYKRHRTLFMVLQWVYLPVTTFIYNCLAALNSQTRLFFGLYLDKFDVTEKAVVDSSGKARS